MSHLCENLIVTQPLQASMGEEGHALQNGSAAPSTSSSEKALAEEAKNAANRDFKGGCYICRTCVHASSLANVVGQLLLQLPQL